MVVLISIMLVLTGCSEGSGSESGQTDVALSENVPKLSETSSLTVLDIKKKYGTESDKSLMPMYNLARDEVFTFKFKSEFDSVIADDIISVHTDVKALKQSKLFTFTDFASFSNSDTIQIKPIDSVLASSDTKEGGWGNAPIYYIRINYDLDAPEPTKLERPIIVPFTIKSDLPVPTLRYEINNSGEFKLVWDKVEGATSYRVYNRKMMGRIGETENLPLNGPEEGYGGMFQFPNLEREVKETELSYFLSSFDPEEPDPDDYYKTHQNLGVNGEYYVTAVNEDKESNFSNVVSTINLSARIPENFEGDIGFKSYNTFSQLPKRASVEFVNGSLSSRDIIYDTDNIRIQESNKTPVYYTVKGTTFKGSVNVKDITEADIEQLKDSQLTESSTGFIEPTNTTDYVPSPDVPTIIEETETSVPQEGPSNNVTDTQKQNTEKKVEEGNKKTVSAPELIKDVEVNADSALEEYLALNMMNAEQEISLRAFPEAQNFETLSDVLQKSMYQNPLVLGVKGLGYDYDSLNLTIKYDDTAESIKKKQEEIIAEAKKIVSSTITTDMSVEQKHKAIYDYLNENTKYDDEALASAKASGFQEVDPKFNDSFNTYGIMVKKVGVCASYASVYKILSDLAGLESVVVTGDMSGVPHAWNKVKLDNGWVNVDSTNNATNSGIPYLLFNSSDETAKSLNFTVSKEFWVDSEIPQFDAKDGSKDYYKVNDLEVTTSSELGEKLSGKVKEGSAFIVLRLAGRVDQAVLIEEAQKALSVLPEDKLKNAQIGSLSSYIMVQY